MKKKIKNLLAVLLTLTCIMGSLGMSSTSVFANTGISVSPVYRLYNPNTGDHFLTIYSSEKNSLVSAGWNDEGILCYTPTSSNLEIKRYRNVNNGKHLFVYIYESLGSEWVSEGTAYYALSDSTQSQKVAVTRLYNPNGDTHTYSTNQTEINNLVAAGWKVDGIMGYGTVAQGNTIVYQ